MAQAQAFFDRRFLAVPDAARRYGVSRSTVWRWIRRQRLPAPIKLSPSVVGWWIDDLVQWEQHWGGGDDERPAA